MSGLHAAVHGWLDAWFSTILVYVAFATVFAGVAVFVTTRVRRAKAASREILLLTALFIMAIPIPLILGSLGLTGRDLVASLFRTEGPTVEITGTVSSETALPAVAAEQIETACVLAVIWIAGVLAMAAVWADRALRAHRLLRNALPGTRRDREVLARIVARSGFREVVDVARIDTLHVPCVSGTSRPCIFLPAGTADRLSDEELETIFAHELAHIRRRDNRVAAAVDLARAVLWFQPVAWIAARRLEIERERACDEAALEIGISSEHYLSAFTQICNHALVSEAGVSCMSTSGLAQRMEDVMTWEARKSQFVAPRWFAVAAMSFVVIACAAGWFMAPAAVAEENGRFTLTGTVTPKDDTVICTLEVRDPAGTLISAPTVTVQKGQKAEVRSGVQSEDGSIERDIRIDILVDVAGAAVASMEVRENGTVVQTSETTLRPVAAAATGDAPPKIDLKLKDASLADVVATFGKLSGYTITLPPGVDGKVTVDLVGVPWTDALTQVLRPFGLRWVRSGDRRIEVRPEADARYLRLGLGITPPICVDRVDPVYPDEARKARIQGIVIIEAQIDETGVVQDAFILKPLPYGLGEAAIDAVKQWRFKPALRDGQPVPVVFNLTVNFKLDAGKPAPEP